MHIALEIAAISLPAAVRPVAVIGNLRGGVVEIDGGFVWTRRPVRREDEYCVEGIERVDFHSHTVLRLRKRQLRARPVVDRAHKTLAVRRRRKAEKSRFRRFQNVQVFRRSVCRRNRSAPRRRGKAAAGHRRVRRARLRAEQRPPHGRQKAPDLPQRFEHALFPAAVHVRPGRPGDAAALTVCGDLQHGVAVHGLRRIADCVLCLGQDGAPVGGDDGADAFLVDGPALPRPIPEFAPVGAVFLHALIAAVRRPVKIVDRHIIGTNRFDSGQQTRIIDEAVAVAFGAALVNPEAVKLILIAARRLHV